jgi:hypothetical protein
MSEGPEEKRTADKISEAIFGKNDCRYLLCNVA